MHHICLIFILSGLHHGGTAAAGQEVAETEGRRKRSAAGRR